MAEVELAVLSLTSCLASTVSEHAAIVLHCVTILQYCVCEGKASGKTCCSQRRQSVVTAPSVAWMSRALRCAIEVYAP